MTTVTVSSSTTGQTVPPYLYGLCSTMGPAFGWDYTMYQNAQLQNLMNQYPTTLVRHNWELNVMMGATISGQQWGIFPTRASVNTPNFSAFDNYLNVLPAIQKFHPVGTREVITLGWPDWLNYTNSSDQTLYGQLCVKVAQHLVAKGYPCQYYELANEPDNMDMTGMCGMFNAAQSALKAYNNTYKMGGLTFTFYYNYGQFFSSCSPDFVSYHHYSVGDTGQSIQTILSNGASVGDEMTAVRSDMTAAGISTSAELFMGEYNVDGEYSDGNIHNHDYVGAVHASAVTTSCAIANVNCTMAALWVLCNSDPYSAFGTATDQGGAGYKLYPHGILLSKLGASMPGPRLGVTGASGNLQVLATRQSNGHAITINNLSASATQAVNLVLTGATASSYTLWQIGSQNQTTPLIQTIPASALATLTVPPVTTFVITSQGSSSTGSLPPGTPGIDKSVVTGTTPAAKTIAYPSTYGRIRDVMQGADGSLYFLTSNTDEVGGQAAGTDSIYKTATLP